MSSRRHIVRSYARDLDALNRSLALMAGRVESMIGKAVRAVREGDIHLAQQVIEEDKAVNRDEVDIDARCLEILACWQPVARDLRFITRILKMVTDLERIGDLAVSICDRSVELAAYPTVPSPAQIDRMSEVVRTMVKESIEAFVERDPQRAEAVIARDDEVDELYHSLLRQQIQRMESDKRLIGPGILIQAVARHLERIGDHCTNLAEQVIFMVRGHDVRHPRSRLE